MSKVTTNTDLSQLVLSPLHIQQLSNRSIHY